MRRSPRLTRLLALALLLQWGAMFVHCLGQAAAAAALSGAICTVDMVGDGAAERPAAPAHAAHMDCPFCQGLAAPPASQPALPTAPVSYTRLVPPTVAGLPPMPARAPPQQPRAPPTA